MKEIRYTLVTDGSSDKALMPILNWLLQDIGVNYPIQGEWADLRRLREPPKKLDERIRKSIELYECNILFVHRDAEKKSHQDRLKEIRAAEKLLVKSLTPIPIVCVIPIRMIESWLLCDEMAIRRAAGNPKGTEKLNLPKTSDIEKIADSKTMLKETLSKAGFPNKRRKKDDISNYRVAEMINDFQPLRSLSAFQELEKELKSILMLHEWI